MNLAQTRIGQIVTVAHVAGEGSFRRRLMELGLVPGTRIEVRRLFFNVPVRRKFLRTTSTEVNHIAEAVTRLALAHPNVQFVGVDVQDSRHGAQTFLTTFGVTYPSVFDPPGAIQTELEMLGPPATFLYDAQGNEVDRVLGLLSPDALASGLAQIRATGAS